MAKWRIYLVAWEPGLTDEGIGSILITPCDCRSVRISVGVE